MNKFYILILTLITFLFSAQNAFAATLGLTPSTGNYARGCIIGLKINLDTQGAQTDGTDVILIYDPAQLSLQTSDIINGSIYQDYPGNSVDQAGGKVSISGISSVSTPFSGNGTFATVNFHVSPAASGVTQIKFDFDPNDKTKTVDTNVVERTTINELLNSVTDGTYTITQTGGCGTATGQGQLGSNGQGQAASSASAIPVKTVLPDTALSGPTMILAGVGMLLTVLGIAGLAMM